MKLWKVSIFQEKHDDRPIREGYVITSSEEEAISIAVKAMGSAGRADLEVRAEDASSLPAERVLWTKL